MFQRAKAGTLALGLFQIITTLSGSAHPLAAQITQSIVAGFVASDAKNQIFIIPLAAPKS